MILNYFNVKVAFCFKTDEGMREHSIDADFTKRTENDTIKDIILAAKEFAEDRLKCLYHDGLNDKEAFIGSIKIYSKTLGPIIDGRLSSNCLVRFFEWKYDWPGTFEDWMNSAI